MKQFNFWALLSAQYLILSLFLPTRFGGLGVIIFSAVSIFGLITKKFQINNPGRLLFFPLIYAILLIGALYAENTSEAFKLIERNLSFLLFPFITQSLTTLSIKQWNTLFHTYLFSALIVSLYCIFIAITVYIDTGSSSINNSDHFIYNIFMHHRLTSPISMHAIYLNLFISFGGLLVIDKLFNKWDSLQKQIKFWYIGYLIFNGIMIYLLKSSILAAAFPIVAGIVYFKKIKVFIFESRMKMLTVGTLAIITTIFFFSIIKTKLGDFKIKQDYSAELLGPLTIRIAIWEGAYNVAKKDWLLGVGTGNLEQPILAEFEMLNFSEGLKNKYNAHSMFLQYWAMNGIFGLFAYLLLLVGLALWAVKTDNRSLLTLILFFTFFSLTESTLQTQRGILFFSFLCAALYWKPKFQQLPS